MAGSTLESHQSMERYKTVHKKEYLADLFSQVDPQDFPGWRDHPLTGNFVDRLYQISHSSRHTDASFALLLNEKPALLVQATREGDKLAWFDLPAHFSLHRGIDPIDSSRIVTRAMRHIQSLGFTSAWIDKGILPPPEANAIDRVCLERGANLTVTAHAVADLTKSEDFLRQDIRESSRSLLNWGQRNLEMRHATATNFDKELLALYPEFHARVSGSAKHISEYWEAFFESIKQGSGEMSLGFYEETLVSALIVMDQGECAYYISAVNDRERFDKPLGHWPLFSSMLRAKARGLRLFDVGEFYCSSGLANEKQDKIAYFKRGFTSGMIYSPSWLIKFS
jgi:hypothetical protein